MFAYYHAGKRGITLDTRAPESLPALEELGTRCRRRRDVAVATSPACRIRRRHPRGVVGTPTTRWSVRDHAVRPHRSVPASARHALRRVRDSGSMHTDRARPKVHRSRSRPAAFGRSGRARRRVHPRRLAEPRRGRRPDDRHLGERSGRQRKDFVFDRYEMMGMTQDRSLVIGYPPTGTWQCQRRAVRRRRAPTAALDSVPADARRSSRALGSVARTTCSYGGRSSTVSPRRSASSSRTATGSELVELGQAAGLPCSILNTPAEFVEDEQLAARDYFVTLPGGGRS